LRAMKFSTRDFMWFRRGEIPVVVIVAQVDRSPFLLTRKARCIPDLRPVYTVTSTLIFDAADYPA
jgi:hypothetical protein